MHSRQDLEAGCRTSRFANPIEGVRVWGSAFALAVGLLGGAGTEGGGKVGESGGGRGVKQNSFKRSLSDV